MAELERHVQLNRATDARAALHVDLRKLHQVEVVPGARRAGLAHVVLRAGRRHVVLLQIHAVVVFEHILEDIKVADLDGDGRIDIVAAARQTKNLVIFFNKSKQR